MESPRLVRARCGDCAQALNRKTLPKGSWGTGSREVVKCGVPDNPELPESLRFGNYMSARHMACTKFRSRGR